MDPEEEHTKGGVQTPPGPVPNTLAFRVEEKSNMKSTKAKILMVFVFAAVAGLLTSGCATTLKPAPGAQKADGLKDAAVSSVAGVSIVAQSKGYPEQWPIEEQITPIHVIISNHSGQPLRLSFSDFALTEMEGERIAARAPESISGMVLSEPVRGYYPFEGIYNGYGIWDPYPFFDDNYARDYPRPIKLPTEKMMRLGLTEGVIENGGQVDGWLYFGKINKEKRPLTFRADLVNAQTGTEFGEISIPFVLE